MLKKVLALMAILYATTCLAAVEANTATEAELDGINGIGPAMSSKILAERHKSDFESWQDLMKRVKGIREKNAARFSTQGMTVNGAPFKESSTASASSTAKK